MTQLPDKEQISAYVDGELSGSEREALERQLGESAELRREAEDYRSLSQLLKTLPPEQVPPEFRSQVLQAAERGMLLDEPAAARPSVAPAVDRSVPDAQAPSRRANWWPAVTIVATAAGVLVMVQLFRGGAETGSDGFSKNVATIETETQTPGVDERRTAALSDRAAPIVESAPAARAMELDTIEADPPVAADLAAASPATVEATTEVGGLSGQLAGTHQLVFNKDLKSTHVGEVLEAIDTSGEEVVVFRVTVVDMRAGLRDLEVLLMREDIHRESELSGEARERQDVQLQAGQMFAIYAEATRDQLSLALASLKEREAFQDQRMHFEKTVELAMLDQEVPEFSRFRSLAPGELAKDAESVPADAPAEPAATARNANAPAAPETPSQESELAASDLDGVKKQIAGPPKPALTAKTTARMSRQLQVQVSEELLHRAKVGNRDSPDEKLDRSAHARAQRGREELKEIAKRQVPADKPMQVLFVLVPADTPAASQPAKAGAPPHGGPDAGENGSPKGAMLLRRTLFPPV